MGNTKGTQNITDIAIASRRRSTQSATNSIKLISKVTAPTKTCELSERDIAFLCSQTGFQSNEVIDWHNKFFTDNPEGRLDRTGFRKFYALLRNDKAERIDDMCDHVFRAFDIDGNGYLEFGEFLLGFAVCSHGDLRSRLNYAFECYDIDSNGYLTEDEIALVLRAMYTLLGIQHVKDYPPEQVAKDIMTKLDVIKDGRISRDEFIDVLTKEGIYRNMINPFH